ncbi:serine/threonine-protein kinase [Candidatus Uabimicrobium amorphum]|uniref:Protein kinase n=1 Tax=Uabimicrobium amorphum TaxID=2596890 RepID=A0A5S9IUN9_UABAM|nr:serine/threonine-protein kinase [Candidatus Uabimicrobium amorphum]BBM88244.1 protein kinase [Candidatus Uabimicrobium amorphum]
MLLPNNRYHIQKVLGHGGMGNVYLALDTTTNLQVAIKECSLNKDEPDVTARRIQREYHFMKTINHPNVVKGLDFFPGKGKLFIVMEYVKGLTLEDLIRRYPRSLSLDQQIEISQKICQGIAALNEHGIIHRDIKPSNIMLTKDYTPKILDLGMAKNINSELSKLTKTGSIVGTPGYMSPEQIDPQLKVGSNTDVFSLGVVFYQFFTWEKYSPFYGGSVISTIDRIVNMKLPKIHTLVVEKNPQLMEVSHIINSALQKKPEERIASVRVMLEMFESKEISLELRKINEQLKRTSARRRHKPQKSYFAWYVTICVTLSILIMIAIISR